MGFVWKDFSRKFFLVVMSFLVLTGLVLIGSTTAFAKEVGRKKAAEYFDKEIEPAKETFEKATKGSSEHLLMLHIGSYTNSTAYAWKGSDKRDGVAKSSYGVTYLFDQWHNIDVNLRADFNEFKLDDTRATKLSLMPLLTLPMAESHFPLYFGIGAGVGVFFTQVEQESSLSFDYQLMVGARFTELIENFGVFIEYGLKNHLHALSDGQLNATAISGGAVFTF